MTFADTKGRHCTPAVVRKLILEVLADGEYHERLTIIREVHELHTARGGIGANESRKTGVVKEGLSWLKKEGVVEHGDKRYWRLSRQHLDSMPAFRSPAPPDSARGEDSAKASKLLDMPRARPRRLELDDEEEPKAPRVLGKGPESVYVFYYPIHRKLARLTGKQTWACKIGHTKDDDPADRVNAQGAKTGQPEPAVIALHLRTEKARYLEKALHAALDFCDARIRDKDSRRHGREWFDTTPQRVERCYELFLASLAALRDDG